jgi:6-phosphofructokinase 2
MHTIVTLTMNPAVDQSCSTPFITNNKKLRCTEPHYEPGGGGINVARAITNLGGTANAIYPVGGCTGNLLVQLLNERLLKHQGVPMAGTTRINLSIIDDTTGKQYRFNMPGAPMTKAEWQACINELTSLSTPSFLVLSGSLPPGVPPDFYTQVVTAFAKTDCKIILDTSGKALQATTDSHVYLMKPNLKELGDLAGKTIEDEEDLITSAQQLTQDGSCDIVVVSVGAGGAFLITKDSVEHEVAPLVPIRSRIGAGDCTVAGMVYSLAQGHSVTDAFRYGIAAGAAAVMRPGTELCRREDVERLYDHLTSHRQAHTAECIV